MTYSLRPAAAGDAGFLWAMLYEASYAAENGVPDVAALREHAELARYVEGWGDRTDLERRRPQEDPIDNDGPNIEQNQTCERKRHTAEVPPW